MGIKVLDCTLRDGGYINDWRFGHTVIRSIINKLTQAHVDIIECGFLEDGEYDRECSMFTDVDQIAALLPKERGTTEYVAMTRYGFLDIDRLKSYDGNSINGIRITFHEDEVAGALAFCKQVQEKGYQVYVQPVGTTSYSDQYLLQLIEEVNALQPYAFYIVDTLGLMKKSDLLRMFYLVDNNLNKNIVLGFHSHNNLQLSFSNSQELVDLNSKRQITLDSSVFGMGRGAGNLNTELITQYLNDAKDSQYGIVSVLEIIDDTISKIAEQHSWGYAVPYYLAAINNCHPNYASYLMERNTLTVKSIGEILERIVPAQRELYNKEYIQEQYTQYQKQQIDSSVAYSRLEAAFQGQSILIVAPGSNFRKQSARIEQYRDQHNARVISVNFTGDYIAPDYCFFSNDKRFQQYEESSEGSVDPVYELILTSNIETERTEHIQRVNYSDLLNNQPLVNDNATLMLLALLMKLGVTNLAIAGFDGFNVIKDNYAEGQLETTLEQLTIEEMNKQIREVVQTYRRRIDIDFITESIYQ